MSEIVVGIDESAGAQGALAFATRVACPAVAPCGYADAGPIGPVLRTP
jgi:hypothetical protein